MFMKFLKYTPVFTRWNRMYSIDEAPLIKLYDRHRPTTSLQKLLLSAGSAFSVLGNPERTDMLAVLGEVTGHDALKSVYECMKSDPTGSLILEEKPMMRSSSVCMDFLKKKNENTFGYIYANFMETHGFDLDGRAHVQYVDDPELAYVMQRFREMHDFWHVIFDLPPTEFGEIALKFVELTQTGLPVCALSGFVGPMRLSTAQRYRLVSDFLPWAYRIGKNCPNLMNIYYENEFDTPLDDLRSNLCVELAPVIHK